MDHYKSSGDISYSNYNNLSKTSIDIQSFSRLPKVIQGHPMIPMMTQCHLRIPMTAQYHLRYPRSLKAIQGYPRLPKAIYIDTQDFPKLVMIPKTHNLHIQRYLRPMKTARPLNSTQDYWGLSKATHIQKSQKEKRREAHMEDNSNGPTWRNCFHFWKMDKIVQARKHSLPGGPWKQSLWGLMY